MSAMDLNTIKSCFFCINNTLSKLLLGFLDIFQSHFFWNLLWQTGEVICSFNRDGWRCNNWNSSSYAWVSCPTSMENLNEDLSILLMNTIDDFFPSLNLFFGIDVTSAGESSSPWWPAWSLGQDKSSSGSLLVVLDKKISWNSILRIASDTSQGGHHHSVFKGDGSFGNRITPRFYWHFWYLIIKFC